MSTPKFIIEKATKILPAYYSPSQIVVKESGSKYVIISMTKLPKADPILEARISGWIQKAMEICGCSNVGVEAVLSHTRGDITTDMLIKWD